MMTYILEKKRLFLILLQTLAVICQLALSPLAYGQSIIPRAKSPALPIQGSPATSVAQPTVQLISKKSASKPIKSVVAKAKSKSAKAKRVATGVCPQILMAKHKASPNDYIPLPEKEFAEGETTASNVPSPAFVDPVLGAAAAAKSVGSPSASASSGASAPEEEFSLEHVFKVLADADQARQKYELATDSKDADKKAFAEKAQVYIAALKVYLDNQGIETKQSELAAELQTEMGVTWPTLTILTEGVHRLNRFAVGLQRRYQTELVIDFIWLMKNQAGAAFLPKSNKLIVSTDAIKTERATIKEMHEVLHVRFKAQREQREKDSIDAPFQMFFVSSEPVKSEKYIHNYEFEMTFEEIWAYSYEVGALAAQLEGKPDKAKEYELSESIKSLVGLAETAEKAGEVAKLAGLENNPELEQIDNVPYTTFKISEEFVFAVALTPAAQANTIDFAIDKINQAQRLSNFIQDYWAQIETLKPDEIQKSGTEYRAALIGFIKEELNSGRSTAEATFDIIAYLDYLDHITGSYSSEPNGLR